MDRPTAIADAGVSLIANRGIRALTHHAIDDQLGLARGSTSYYARTRRDLIVLIVHRLTDQRQADLTRIQIAEPATPRRVAQAIAAAIQEASRRPAEYLARMALLLELAHDAELQRALSATSPVRAEARTAAELVLAGWGVADPEARADDLIGLIDGLMTQVIVRGTKLDVESILCAYFLGLLAQPEPADAGTAAPSPPGV